MNDSIVDVSVIMLTKDGEKYLAEVLDRVVGQDFDGTSEIIVIDSGSADRTLEIVGQFPVQLMCIEPKEFNHGATRNCGARHAQGRYLVYLTQDATPANAQWLGTLLRSLSESQVAGAFSRQVPRPDAGAFEKYFLHQTYHTRPEIHSLSKSGGVTFKSCFFSNVGSAIKRDIWKEHPFREDLVMSEDQEWARQVLLDGHSIVYEPEAMVYHSHHYKLVDIFKRNFDSGTSLAQIFGNDLGYTFRGTLEYLIGELLYLLKLGCWREIPYWVIYELSRIAGFSIGHKLGDRLPKSVCARLGQCQPYWGKFS